MIMGIMENKVEHPAPRKSQHGSAPSGAAGEVSGAGAAIAAMRDVEKDKDLEET